MSLHVRWVVRVADTRRAPQLRGIYGFNIINLVLNTHDSS